MTLGLDVAVGVSRLANGRVPHLLLDPPEVCSVTQKPGGIGVTGRVVLAIGKPGFAQERLPDTFEEVAVPDDPARRRREHELPLLSGPVLDLTLKLHCS